MSRGWRNRCIIRILEKDSADVIGIFKLDDDDLIAKDFVLHAKQYLEPQFSNFVVSFPAGLTGWYSSKDGFFCIKKIYQPKINIGLMEVLPVSHVGSSSTKREVEVEFRNIGSHGTVDTRFPTILDASFPAFFWTRTGIQDTAVKNQTFVDKVERKLSKLELASKEQLERFDLSPKAIR